MAVQTKTWNGRTWDFGPDKRIWTHVKTRGVESAIWGVIFCQTFIPMALYQAPAQGAVLSAVAPENLFGAGGGDFDSDEYTYTTVSDMDTELAEKAGISGGNGNAEELIKPLGFRTSGTQEQEIFRVNLFKYSDAQLPVESPKTSSGFGWREAPCAECSSDHNGVDFVPGRGSPIYAVLDGLVIEAGVLGGYGWWVKLEHRVPGANGIVEKWETIYAHMEAESIPGGVKIGAVVEKGQILGTVGSTGVSTGPHLHFEIRINGNNVDPLPMIAEYQALKQDENGELKETYK
jgi:murein DD-endopeptidase MepM/ murein hydrolase activator NlpD